jgi:hypothetical protein
MAAMVEVICEYGGKSRKTPKDEGIPRCVFIGRKKINVFKL